MGERCCAFQKNFFGALFVLFQKLDIGVLSEFLKPCFDFQAVRKKIFGSAVQFAREFPVHRQTFVDFCKARFVDVETIEAV